MLNVEYFKHAPNPTFNFHLINGNLIFVCGNAIKDSFGSWSVVTFKISHFLKKLISLWRFQIEITVNLITFG